MKQVPLLKVSVFDVMKALAFVGDLSMGQPIDHSTRTAWIAMQLAQVAGLSATEQAYVGCVGLLRWSGCTANAPDFSDLLGDDVIGRRGMLSEISVANAGQFARSIGPLAEIHCEVSGDIAKTLLLPVEVEAPLRAIFEMFNGHGKPVGLSGRDIPQAVYLISIASDLEIFSRVHGLDMAMRALDERSNVRYPQELVSMTRLHAAQWIDAVERGAAASLDLASAKLPSQDASPELIADVVDLKVPWMTGFSRRVAAVASEIGLRLSLSTDAMNSLMCGALIHGIGRASVPNAVWDRFDTCGESDRERLRLVAYWTHRVGGRIPALNRSAEIGSYVDERLDGSGSFRGVKGVAIELESRILAAAYRWEWLRLARPGTTNHSASDALNILQHEATLGLLDEVVVSALSAVLTGVQLGAPGSTQGQGVQPSLLSEREIEVLRRISLGESNKEAARTLGISPNTVRAHLENIFRKLSCNTRAAATLKASTLGLISSM